MSYKSIFSRVLDFNLLRCKKQEIENIFSRKVNMMGKLIWDFKKGKSGMSIKRARVQIKSENTNMATGMK